MKKQRILQLSILATSLSSCAHTNVEAASVCEIIATGTPEVGSIVRLQGLYLATLGHGSSLTDPNCPNRGLPDLTPDSPRQDRSVIEFYGSVTPDVFDPKKPPGYWSVDATVRIVSAKDVTTPLGIAQSPIAIGLEFQRIWSYEPATER